MPVYEYYCPDCHKIYQFFARSINNDKTPDCPVCNHKNLQKEISTFALLKNLTGTDHAADTDIMQALTDLAKESQSLESSTQSGQEARAAKAVLNFLKSTGTQSDGQLEEALAKTIKDNDINLTEHELEEKLNDPEYSVLLEQIKKYKHCAKKPPIDDKLYDL